MSQPTLSGAGQVKMATVEEANELVSRLHSTVERLGLAIKQNQNTGLFYQQIRRILDALVGKLKAPFGMISDQAAAVNLVSSRGGADAAKLRALREGVAQLKQALEIAERKVKEQHMVGGDAPQKE